MALGQEVRHQSESFKRLAALTLASLLLCLSFIISYFASFPVALAALIYGRAKGYGAMVVAWVLSLLLSVFVLREPVLFATYTASLFITIPCAEIALRNIHPIKGVFYAGMILLSLFFAGLFAGLSGSQKGLHEMTVDKIVELRPNLLKQLDGQTGEEVFQVKAFLNNPEKFAQRLLEEAPGYLAMGIFLILWANIFLLFKAKRTLLRARRPYTDIDLVNFKVPDQVIWAVIIALVLAVFGDYYSELAPVVGMNLLKILGVFYFFQGFGLYISFLDYLRLGGILRSVLVILTILLAGQVLAVAGLFDMFFNFRKFMKRKDQGE